MICCNVGIPILNCAASCSIPENQRYDILQLPVLLHYGDVTCYCFHTEKSGRPQISNVLSAILLN